MLTEIIQTGKDKYHMISLTCGIWKTEQMNKHNKRNRVIDTENKQVIAGEGGVGNERNRWGRLRGTNYV